MQNLLESIDYNIKSVEDLLNKRTYLATLEESTKKELLKIDDTIEFIKESKTYYVKAVDIMYEESIGSLKDTLNTALQYIMFDKNYKVNMILEDKRGGKTLDITLVDLDEDFEVDLKDGVGQGVRTIISFVLKMYYLINKDSKILFLDEKYSALSEHYIPRFFEFASQLLKEKEMTLVMITHDNRFIDYADKTYLINDGHVSIIESDVVKERPLDNDNN